MRTWLADERRRNLLSQKEMAQKLGIAESYYCLIEQGKRQKRMDITLLSALATIFDMPLAQIVALEQEN